MLSCGAASRSLPVESQLEVANDSVPCSLSFLRAELPSGDG